MAFCLKWRLINDGVEVPHLELPSIHELEMKAAAIGWGQIRGKMLNAVVETAGMLLLYYSKP